MEEKLYEWQEKYGASLSAYGTCLEKMKKRWGQYEGEHKVYNADGTVGKDSSHKRNFTYELIECQVGTEIPMPKVSSPSEEPKKKERAKIIEAFLRGWVRRISSDGINDGDDRICKVLGSSFLFVYWDSNGGGHDFSGIPCIRSLHPSQVIPQAGVKNIENMDYIFVLFSDTKKNLERIYGVSLEGETSEENSEQSDNQLENPAEVITQISAYYRNDKGRIGVFSWAGNTVLEDIEDYNSRQIKVCAKCGAPNLLGDSKCACGCKKFISKADEKEEIVRDIYLSDGRIIPSRVRVYDDEGLPVFEKISGGFDNEGNEIFTTVEMTKENSIPYYVPTAFPIVNRKNTVLYDSFLGDSDVDRIADLQFSHDKLATKIQERLLKGGSVITLPKGTKIETSDKEMKVVYIDNAAQKAMIDCLVVEPRLEQDVAMLNKYYEDARSTLGITDAFQGKPDSTAISGRAKEASITQASGRLMSKEKLKQAAWEEVYKRVFQYMLAYADEPRRFIGTDEEGKEQEYTFDRYMFLDVDESGEYYYDDDFLFETDKAASFAADRQNMWKECRLNFQSGAYGNIQDPESALLFWKMMENYNYPSAAAAIKFFENKAAELSAHDSFGGEEDE